jgi:hypothetical protein
MQSTFTTITNLIENIKSPLLNATPRLGSSGRNKHHGLGDGYDEGAVFEDMESLMRGKEGVEGDEEDVVLKNGKRVRKVELRIGGMTVSSSCLYPPFPL